MLRRFTFGLCLLLAGCDCSGTDIPPGAEGAPCDTADDCDGALTCSDGVCTRVVTSDGGRVVGEDASVPRPDAGPVCPAASRCGADCCEASEECVDGVCLAECASGLRCGPTNACCADGDLCIDDACVAPGAPCEELIDCPADAYCDQTLGRCLPQSDTRCEFYPTPGEITPALQWRWPEAGAVLPASVHVMMTPVVGDLSRDGIPEVAFITYTGSAYTSAGVLRVHRGDTGAELFTVDTPTVCGSTGVALGDLDGDGVPEIVTAGPCASSRILAFDNEGNHLWSSVTSDGSPFSMQIDYGAPALADLEGDGVAEIVLTGTVIEHDGTLRFSHRGDARSVGVPYDVDGDGDLEVLAPDGAWHHDGTPLWDTPALPDGLIAVADFFEDGQPDIVVTAGGVLNVYRALDGALVWGPIDQVGGGQGGPPTVADFDGDGLPEIGIAGANAYVVYDPDGDEPVLWQSATEDNSSHRTGSSVFDFDGDGSAEVVYNDECAMRIYQGRDGAILAEVDNASHTRIEYPVIVDVDADGNTEIVFAANAATPACSQIASDLSYSGYEPGIRVYGDAADNWVGTRRVWNQHGYSITHVREDLRIPATTAPNHTRFNNFRQNPQSFDAPDLLPSALDADVTGCPGTITLSTTVTNEGAAPVGPGLEVSFYVGPEGSGRLVGTATTITLLVPGASERVSVSFVPTSDDLDADLSWYVTVDDGGDGAGAQNECREDNNTQAATFRCSGLG